MYDEQTDATTTTVSQYYSIAGMTVAMRSGTTWSWFLTDHLGSVVGITNDAGTLVGETRYLPFGEVRSGVGIAITQTDFGYTFQRVVTGSGLMDYRARMYDPWLGRFVQPDTIIPGAGNPQAYNRYGYSNNNPIKYNDPNGHWACEEAFDCSKRSASAKEPLRKTRNSSSTSSTTPTIIPTVTPTVTPTFPSNSTLAPYTFSTPMALSTTPNSNSESSDEPSYGPWPPSGYTIEPARRMNLKKIEWLGLITNSAGVIGDIALGVGVIIPPAYAVGEVLNLIDIGGFLYNGVESMMDHDYSGTTIDILEIGEELTSRSDSLRVIPFIGFVFNLSGVKESWEAGYEQYDKLIPIQ